MNLKTIGIVHSTRKEIRDDDWNSENAFIELAAEIPTDALSGITDFSHAEILFFMDQVDLAKIEVGARHPRNNSEWPKVGIFAQRGKNRPNQIGLTVCEIIKVEGRRLYLKGLDAVDGTPVLDIKPWMKEFAPPGSTRQPRWASELMENYWKAPESTKEEQSEEQNWINSIKQLRNDGKIDEAFVNVKAAISKLPKSARLHYLAASICDAHRTEAEAVPFYLKALELGLVGNQLRDAYLGLGSTYRSLGQYEKSAEIFLTALQIFPDYKPYQVFLALTEYNLQKTNSAVERLLNVLLETTGDSDIRAYERALKFYAPRLDETFE